MTSVVSCKSKLGADGLDADGVQIGMETRFGLFSVCIQERRCRRADGQYIGATAQVRRASAHEYFFCGRWRPAPNPSPLRILRSTTLRRKRKNFDQTRSSRETKIEDAPSAPCPTVVDLTSKRKSANPPALMTELHENLEHYAYKIPAL